MPRTDISSPLSTLFGDGYGDLYEAAGSPALSGTAVFTPLEDKMLSGTLTTRAGAPGEAGGIRAAKGVEEADGGSVHNH